MNWSQRLERVSEWTGRAVAWLTLPMVVGTFVIVTLRYAFDTGWIWMQESVIWMHAAVFMLAAAYTLRDDEHVRVDIFYRKLDPRGRALVDIAGTVLLLLPMMGFILLVSFDYVAVSWSIREGSREAGGLPYPFVPLLKSVIPATALLVILQAIAKLLANFALLRRGTQVPPTQAQPD
jgi:TRAP-type mannitol/chloroaromatic compound transport system permease small subunit